MISLLTRVLVFNVLNLSGCFKVLILYWGSLDSSKSVVDEPVSIRQQSLSLPMVISISGKFVFEDSIENLSHVRYGLHP